MNDLIEYIPGHCDNQNVAAVIPAKTPNISQQFTPFRRGVLISDSTTSGRISRTSRNPFVCILRCENLRAMSAQELGSQ
jgi:hypothetical protein